MSHLRRAAVVCAALLLSGCAVAPAPEPSAARPAPPSPAAAVAAARSEAAAVSGLSLIATLRRPTPVLTAPGGPRLTLQGDRTDEGTRQRLLVLEDHDAWLRVALPGRPHGRTGWVRAGDVDLAATDWQLQVSLAQRTLTVLRGGLVVGTHPVAVGAPGTPTPVGDFFVTDLMAPPDPAGSYGPFAFGLSAYSDVLTSFAGGRGQIGLHGTDEPASLGRPASNGCLRLANDAVRALAGQLPLGTPVRVRA